MASIENDGFWSLTDALNPNSKKETRLVSAVVTKVDDEGTPWVHIPSAADETPINGVSTAEVKPGDTVQVEIENGRANLIGNASAPSVGQEKVDETIAPVKQVAERAASQIGEAADAAEAAEQAAAAAQAVAEATSQHFWDADDGAHVTEVTQEEWNDPTSENYHSGANVLINSLGQLFRRGLNNLLALLPAQTITATETTTAAESTFIVDVGHEIGTVESVTINGTPTTDYTYTTGDKYLFLDDNVPSGTVIAVTYTYRAKTTIAFFDGAGNDAGNISARFSEDEIIIGKEDSGRLRLTEYGLGTYFPNVETGGEPVMELGGYGLILRNGDGITHQKFLTNGKALWVTGTTLYFLSSYAGEMGNFVPLVGYAMEPDKSTGYGTGTIAFYGDKIGFRYVADPSAYPPSLSGGYVKMKDIYESFADTGWQTITSTSGTVQYRIKGGFCTVRVNACDVTTTWATIATLPEAARPADTMGAAGYSGGAGRNHMALIAQANGAVRVSAPTAATGNGSGVVTYPLG